MDTSSTTKAFNKSFAICKRFFSMSALLLAASLVTQNAKAASEAEDFVLDKTTYEDGLLPATVYTLKNGLTLIVHQDHDVPVVAINVWYHVGAKDEPHGKSGFAHLFEHLMFNGTENFNQDYFKPLELAGATNLNGTTNSDRTNYFQTVPVGALDLVLWLESDRMGHLLGAIDLDKLDEQRDVVKNEKRQGEDQPYGKVWGELAKGTFPNRHPYSWSVIGSMEDLSNASVEDVHGWFKQYYGPNNATLVLAGDITPEDALERVYHYFGDIPPGPENPRHVNNIAPRIERVERVLYDTVTTPRLYMVWNTPSIKDETSPTQNLLSDLLASGRDSILYKRLVVEEEIATQVAAFYYDREIAGQFIVLVDGKPDSDLDQLEQAVHEEIAKISKGRAIKTKEIRARVNAMKANLIRGLDRLGGFGGKSDLLARSSVLIDDPSYIDTYIDLLDAQNPRTFKNFASEWLQFEATFSLRVIPELKLEAGKASADRSQLPVPAAVAKFDLGDWQRGKISNGLEVVVKPRTGLPLVAVGLLTPAGYAASSEQPGIANFTWNAMTELGTSRLSGAELEAALNELGASISSGSGFDTGNIQLNATTDDLEEAFAIYSELVKAPNFGADGLQRLKENWIVSISQERENGRSMALRAITKLLYPNGHPYHATLSGTGNPDSIAALDAGSLESWYRTWVHPKTAQIVFVGDITFDDALALAEEHFGDWQGTQTPGVAEQKPIQSSSDKATPTVYVIDTPAALQSTVVVGHLLPPVAEADEAALEVANATLGGTFTSRINMNLREEKGWSYGARSRIPSVNAQRPFIAYAGVQTDKTFESLMEMKSEVDRFVTSNPPKEEEVQKIKENRSRRVAGSFETIGSLMGYITNQLHKGRGMDYITKFVESITSLDALQVQVAAKRYLGSDEQVYLIVGDYAVFKEKLDETGFRVVLLKKEDY